MKLRRITIGLAFVTNVLMSSTVTAMPPNGGERMGGRKPPPEAIDACVGKTVGDVSSFISPHGDTVSGSCEKIGEVTALKPDRHRPHESDMRMEK